MSADPEKRMDVEYTPNTDFTKAIIESIRHRVRKLGMTQDELAKKVGYKNRAAISEILSGKISLPLNKLQKFADALNTTVPVLLGEDVDEHTIINGCGYDLEILKKKLQRNGFVDTEIFHTSQEAVDYIAKRCERKDIGIAESSTLIQMGLVDKLMETDGAVYLGDYRSNSEERKKAAKAHVFILSANAIAYDTGDIVNISSDGVRIASSLFHPEEVIFVIGKNKIAPNLGEALKKTRSIVKPQVAAMRGYRTPCMDTGKCEQYCRIPASACKVTCIYHCAVKFINYTVVLVNEKIGVSE